MEVDGSDTVQQIDEEMPFDMQTLIEIMQEESTGQSQKAIVVVVKLMKDMYTSNSESTSEIDETVVSIKDKLLHNVKNPDKVKAVRFVEATIKITNI